MSKKLVIDSYNILLTKESEVYRNKPVVIKELYDAHLWVHHNGYDHVIKKNHTDFSEDKINKIINQNKDE